MGKRSYILIGLAILSLFYIFFTIDINSSMISKEKITSREVKSEEIDAGIELERHIDTGKTFETSITIPVTAIDHIDKPIKAWATEEENAFYDKIKELEGQLSKRAEATFTIEPIVKRVKKQFLTLEMHVQYVIEDIYYETKESVSKVKTFIMYMPKEDEGQLVNLNEFLRIPKIKNKNEFHQFLQLIDDSKAKELIAELNYKNTDQIQWLITKKGIEVLLDHDQEQDPKNEVDRIFIEYQQLKDHVNQPYKKLLIPPTEKKANTDKKDQKKNKVVALTFDDGPDPVVTPKILNVLRQYQAKATFFMLGRNVNKYTAIAKQVAKEGHEIANHSDTHINLNKAKKARIEKEVVANKQLIEDKVGVRTKLFRPPYGEYNKTVIEFANQSDQSIIMWSVDTLDWKHRNKNKLIQIAMRDTKSQSIILMHDIHESTADALASLIDRLKKEGYSFVTVSELIEDLEPASNGVYYGK